MPANAALKGFGNPVLHSQMVFHAAMMALANPGRIHTLTQPDLVAPAPLGTGAAALVIALADYETPIWLDDALAASADIAQYLRFHTGARIVTAPEQASFAIISNPAQLALTLSQFAQGTAEYPDRSTTLILQVETLDTDHGWRLSGPGIIGHRHLLPTPVMPDFLEQWSENYGLFPCGVDILMSAGDRIIGLPRSTKLEV